MESENKNAQLPWHGLLQSLLAFHLIYLLGRPLDFTQLIVQVTIILFVMFSFVPMPKLWPEWSKACLFSSILGLLSANVSRLFLMRKAEGNAFIDLITSPFTASQLVAMGIGFAFGILLTWLRIRFNLRQFLEFMTYSGPPRELPKAED